MHLLDKNRALDGVHTGANQLSLQLPATLRSDQIKAAFKIQSERMALQMY